ncbi:histidine kinase N-terminal 7TM domain-containing protein [Halorientalis brevis]|uniref:histidine kinase n=1 Tax=Halorientalis brevis TaxID=1126241 RepID=A0ABD6C8G8_9EURY|nr:histidine kinase N-terminal 7TM domain-containing protein [Halorientalis brevis]
MGFEYTNYVLPYVVAVLVNLALIARLWRYRNRRAARGFLFDVSGIVLLSVCNALQLLSTTVGAKLFWWNWRFVPITFMAVGYMLTAVEYTNRDHWLTYRTGAALAAVPIVTQALIWTNDSHGLFYGYAYDEAANLLVPQFGPLYWLFAAFVVGCLGVGIYLLLDLARTQVAFTRQATILLGSILLVLAGELLWWFHVIPIDPAPLTSTVKVAGFLFGVARFELLDIVPVARKTVIENMRDAVFVVDRTNRIVDVNQAGKRLVGDGDVVRNAIDEVFDAETIRAHEDMREGQTELTLSLDGEPRHFDFQISPLSADGAAHGGRLFVFRDVTERKRREDELAILNRIVRHDIRNDMSVIDGRGALLEEYVEEGGQEHLQKIRKSSQHVVELTDNVGTLMESIASEQTMEVEPTALSAVLETQLDRARMRHDAAEFVVEGAIPQNSLVTANEMLSSVFTNLFNNAVNHNDSDACRVTVSVTETPASVRVEVADDGPGIPDEKKDDIFGRGAKGLDSSGTGVGLYLVDTLIDHYGGTITVRDNEPTGSVFVIELPRAASRQAQSQPVDNR